MYKIPQTQKRTEVPKTKQLTIEQVDELSDLLAKAKAGDKDCRDTLMERLVLYAVRNYNKNQYKSYWDEYKKEFILGK